MNREEVTEALENIGAAFQDYKAAQSAYATLEKQVQADLKAAKNTRERAFGTYQTAVETFREDLGTDLVSIFETFAVEAVEGSK